VYNVKAGTLIEHCARRLRNYSFLRFLKTARVTIVFAKSYAGGPLGGRVVD
jgi:hypothetical protein